VCVEHKKIVIQFLALAATPITNELAFVSFETISMSGMLLELSKKEL